MISIHIYAYEFIHKYNQIGDPQQLIRVIGSSTKLYPDAEQFYYHENPENLYVMTGIERGLFFFVFSRV